mmetsp:Transcript_72471/g.209777  ORF Transcript_72471/g.209777 Transcript_72471/m.209777 type:complete len:204 (-) Transcript_72471:429-1040(-)
MFSLTLMGSKMSCQVEKLRHSFKSAEAAVVAELRSDDPNRSQASPPAPKVAQAPHERQGSATSPSERKSSRPGGGRGAATTAGASASAVRPAQSKLALTHCTLSGCEASKRTAASPNSGDSTPQSSASKQRMMRPPRRSDGICLCMQTSRRKGVLALRAQAEAFFNCCGPSQSTTMRAGWLSASRDCSSMTQGCASRQSVTNT